MLLTIQNTSEESLSSSSRLYLRARLSIMCVGPRSGRRVDGARRAALGPDGSRTYACLLCVQVSCPGPYLLSSRPISHGAPALTPQGAHGGALGRASIRGSVCVKSI